MSLPKPKIEMFDGVHANYDAKAWRFIKQYAGGGMPYFGMWRGE